MSAPMDNADLAGTGLRMTQSAVMVRVGNAPAAFGVSRATIYRWAKKDHITIHKRGKMSFIDPAEVSNFIKGLGGQVGD